MLNSVIWACGMVSGPGLNTFLIGVVCVPSVQHGLQSNERGSTRHVTKRVSKGFVFDLVYQFVETVTNAFTYLPKKRLLVCLERVTRGNTSR